MNVAKIWALFGVAILMSISSLLQAKLYFDRNQFISNTGIKKTFTAFWYKKLMQYLYVSDQATKAERNDPNYDKLGKIQPLMQMVEQTFQDHFMPGKSQTISEGMIAFKSHLSYMQNMPAKPIKCGIKVWLQCDVETAYLHQFSVYLGHEAYSPMGLGYDFVMKLCEQITGKNHHLYFDNLFTSVPLLKDLLNHKTYACGTVHMNKQNLPDAVKHSGRMVSGAHKAFQFGNTNLGATVWQDNKVVQVLSTNCDPNTVLQANCQIGHQVVQVNQAENVFWTKKHECCWLQWSAAYAVWDRLLFKESIEVFNVVPCKYLNC